MIVIQAFAILLFAGLSLIVSTLPFSSR